jgi:hypothetical protein
MWLRNGADDYRMSELVLLTGEEFVLQVPIDSYRYLQISSDTYRHLQIRTDTYRILHHWI